MKMSSVAGAGVGALAAGLGLVATILTPVAGLALGGYFTYGAVAATMGTGATVALTAAGAVGGLFLGKIAAPIVLLGSLGAAGLVGGLVKGAGSLLEGIFGNKDKKAERASAPARPTFGRDDKPSALADLGSLKVKFGQDRATEPRNDNVPAPAPKFNNTLKF